MSCDVYILAERLPTGYLLLFVCVRLLRTVQIAPVMINSTHSIDTVCNVLLSKDTSAGDGSVCKTERNVTDLQIVRGNYGNTMEQIKSNALLKFNDNQLSDVRKAVGYEDVSKLKQDIEHLKDWIKKQNHFKVKEFDEEYLERVLIYNKGSIERAKQRFDKLCTCTNLMPEFLQNFDIKNEFKHIFNISYTGVLPQPTKENYRVLVSSSLGSDDSDFHLIQFYRYLQVLGQYILYNDYCHGYEIIGDTRKLTMGNIAKVNPVIIHKGLILMTEVMGQRLKRMHLLSGSKLFDSLVILVKQGLSAKLKERLIIHPNVESLREYFPKELLPKDLGGGEKSMKELNDLNFQELSSDSHIARIKFMETIGTDESRRVVCKFNEEYSGMPGSFKTLCVD